MKKHTVALGVLLGLLVISSSRVVFAQSTANLKLDAPSAVSSGEEFDVSLLVENVVNLGGFQFVLGFDPELVTAIGVTKGDFLGSSGREVVCDDPVLSDSGVRLECVTLGPEPPGADGAGVLAVVRLRSTGDGSAALALSRTKLVQPNGTEIQHVASDARTSTGDQRDWRPFIWGGVIAGGALLILFGAVLVRTRRPGERRLQAGPIEAPGPSAPPEA
ncbi:MAG: cohesin domain-containing protein [Dehalococcoidia bacterium]